VDEDARREREVVIAVDRQVVDIRGFGKGLYSHHGVIHQRHSLAETSDVAVVRVQQPLPPQSGPGVAEPVCFIGGSELIVRKIQEIRESLQSRPPAAFVLLRHALRCGHIPKVGIASGMQL
jgi:hypothetical protein